MGDRAAEDPILKNAGHEVGRLRQKGAGRWAALLCPALMAACAEFYDGPPPTPDPLVPFEGRASLSEDEKGADRLRSFELRCASPAVVRCVSFDSADQIPDLSWWAVGENQGRGPMGLIKNNENAVLPVLDCALAVSGCSLRFTVPSHSGSSASGSWFTNFSDDFFGSKFWVKN